METSPFVRIVADIFVILLVYIMPWWVTLVALIFFTFHFVKYYESILFTVVISTLYFDVVPGRFMVWLLPLLAVVVYFTLESFKRRLTRYSS